MNLARLLNIKDKPSHGNLSLGWQLLDFNLTTFQVKLNPDMESIPGRDNFLLNLLWSKGNEIPLYEFLELGGVKTHAFNPGLEAWRHTFIMATHSSGWLQKNMQEGGFCSFSPCPCLVSKSIPSLKSYCFITVPAYTEDQSRDAALWIEKLLDFYCSL